jgi:hypothetical protein
MNGLSDLDLVAQAMAPINDLKPISSTSVSPAITSAPNPTSNATHHQSLPNPEPNLDLSNLTPQDRELLKPLIDALSMDGGEEGEDEEIRIADILAQMDVAGEVADDIEGKLDRLLESLGKVEQEITQETGKTGNGP